MSKKMDASTRHPIRIAVLFGRSKRAWLSRLISALRHGNTATLPDQLFTPRLLLLGLLMTSRMAFPGELADEMARCEEVVASSPASRDKTACERRLNWLRLRRTSDGTFLHAEALKEVRETSRLLSPDKARARVSTIADDESAPIQIRLEALIWLSREALRRGEDATALTHSETLWQQVQAGAGTPDTQREIADLHSRALASNGQPDAAAQVEAAAQLPRSARPREGIALLQQKQQRTRRHQLCSGVLMVFALACGPRALKTWRHSPRPRPQGLLPLVGAIGLSAALSVAHSPTSAPAFLWLLIGAALIHVVGLGALIAARTKATRRLTATLAGFATLALGYLVAEQAGLLDTFGL